MRTRTRTVSGYLNSVRRRLNFIWGQSNAEGKGLASDLPSALQVGQPWVQYSLTEILSGISFPTWQRSWGAVGTFGGEHGIEITFAADVVVSNKPTALCKWARGGTDLPSFLSTWYAPSVAFFQAQRAAAPFPVDLGSLIVLQGETDATDATNAAAWSANFSTIVSQFRTDLAAPTLPVMVYQLNSADTIPFLSTVRAQQASWVAAEVAAGRRAALINVDGTPVQPDGLHLTSAGLQLFGNLAAAQNAVWFP